MIVVPFTSDPFHTFRCPLNGVEYIFDVAWNIRGNLWTFDLLLDSTGLPIVTGVPIVVGCDLLQNYALGIGTMFAIDMAATPKIALVDDTGTTASILQHTDATVDDLGTRIVVVYLAPGEALPT